MHKPLPFHHMVTYTSESGFSAAELACLSDQAEKLDSDFEKRKT